MKWLQISIACAREQIHHIEEVLFFYGAESVDISDLEFNPIYENQVGEIIFWDSCRIKAIFNPKINIYQLKKSLKNLCSNIDQNFFEDRDWIEEFNKNLKSSFLGKRLYVCPSNCNKFIGIGVKTLKLDPGLAFGSGTHDTTTLCLNFIDKFSFEEKITIDYGCGSGILAIAMALLGAKEVHAIDIDKIALDVTEFNSRNNKCIDKIKTDYAIKDDIAADLIIANILLDTLINSKEIFFKSLKNNGVLVLTGILRSQLEAIYKHYLDKFKLNNIFYEHEWCLIELIKT